MAVRPGITVGHQPEKETVWQEHLKKKQARRRSMFEPSSNPTLFQLHNQKVPIIAFS